MKKLAILSCLKANERCTGAGCMRAFNGRTAGFEHYADEPLELVAFTRCSHCHEQLDPLSDAGFLRKLARLKELGTDVVHIGHCAKRGGIECPGMKRMAEAIERSGIAVVWGTH